MQEIMIDDVLKGDRIRVETSMPEGFGWDALEYTAEEDQRAWGGWNPFDRKDFEEKHHLYLIERATPEPVDGMRIQREEHDAYYVGVRIEGEWLVHDNDHIEAHWKDDSWYQEKMRKGWVIKSD